MSFHPVYSKEVEEALAEEFKDVLKGRVYVDHAGATLYSRQQITDVHADLALSLFANPHSKSTVGKTTGDLIDAVRDQVLAFFNAPPHEYSVIFTSGATAALKLVAESFDYQNGRLVYLAESHTSVLGMRAHAPQWSALSTEQAHDAFSSAQGGGALNAQNDNHSNANCNNLFVYPAQCNFSGRKYPLEWVRQAQNGALANATGEKWYCLLDAASYVATNPLDLSECQPDFVCLSFYKIFGYPTGLGALVVRNASGGVLRKKYFGGGTVLMALASQDAVVHRSNLQDRFEDGTLPFLSIVSLKHGFAALKWHHLDMSTVQAHVFTLARHLYDALAGLVHYNGQPVCVLYHDGHFKTAARQGGIVNFNCLRADGTYVGFAEVMHFANLYNISLRTGCFCNPGACQRHLGISSEEVQHHYEMGHVCGDQRDLIDGKPTGSVRISFGYMSTQADADAVIDVMRSCFQQRSRQPDAHAIGATSPPDGAAVDLGVRAADAIVGHLEKIFIYPIKSCAALEVTHAWRLVPTGLQYDREWMVVDREGVCLTQKREARMCLIQPSVDLRRKQLILGFNGAGGCVTTGDVVECVRLDLDAAGGSYRCHSRICGDRVQGWDCGDEAAAWLDAVLGRDGLRLIRRFDRSARSKPSAAPDAQLSLANQAQFLLINKASVQWLYERVPDDAHALRGEESLSASVAQFRPNFLVDFGRAFAENAAAEIYIGSARFAVQGQCTRCQMICIDQATGRKTAEPLRTLSRTLRGQMRFGIYLQMAPCSARDPGGCSCAVAPAMATAALTAGDV